MTTTLVTIERSAPGTWQLRIGGGMTTWPLECDGPPHVVADELIEAIERESRHVEVIRRGPASFTVNAPVRVEQEPQPGCITVTAVDP